MKNLSFSYTFPLDVTGLHRVKSSLSSYLPTSLGGDLLRKNTTRSVLVSLALFSLSCLPAHAQASTLFPLEIMGVGPSYGKTITINVSSNLVSQIKGIKLRTNNLASEAQGKIQIGANTSFIDLTNTSAKVLGNGKVYGGIGGAFSTVEMIVPVPAGRVVAGDNQIAFQQNQINNNTQGKRI